MNLPFHEGLLFGSNVLLLGWTRKGTVTLLSCSGVQPRNRISTTSTSRGTSTTERFWAFGHIATLVMAIRFSCAKHRNLHDGFD